MKPFPAFCMLLFFLTGSVYAQTPASPTPQALQERMRRHATTTLEAVNEAYRAQRPTLDLPAAAFTPEGLETVRALWQNTPFYCARIDTEQPVILRGDSLGYELRRIPLMVETDPKHPRRIDGVFLFTPEGLIEDLRFGLDLHQESLVLDAARSVTEFRQRQIILDFVEKYRTAYSYKDLPFIESIFSDHALIIVGQVVQVDETSPDEMGITPRNVQVALIRRSKQEYLERLRGVFDTNASIHVAFDSLDVFRHPRHPDIYGITLLQHWNTATYSDRGYVFLMIDFRDPDRPIIHVRSWQPEAYTPRSDVLSLGDFEIIR